MDYKEITNRIDELNLDGYKHIKNNDWGCPEELEKWLISKNFELIGEGAFSKVFQSPTEKFVVKVNMDNDDEPATDFGYQKFLDLCRENKGNPHLPKIGNPKIIKTEGREYNIVFIEKLERLKFAYKKVVSFIDYSLSYQNNLVKDEYDKMVERLSPDQYKQSMEIINLLKNVDGIVYDLHGGNFMMRGDTLVVIDPFYSTDEE